MSDQNPIVFYPGKVQLIPIAINIAIAPVLLYLSGLWPWPPLLLHYVVFFITAIIAIQFLRRGLAKPRLIFDATGIHYAGASYAAESIVGVKPYMRALQIWIKKDGREKEKVINLWWAGKDDMRKIYEIALARYGIKS